MAIVPPVPNPIIADERGSRPVPDPTLLTTQQLERSITGLHDLIGAKLAELTSIQNRMQVEIAGVPSLVAEAIGHLRALHEEKFRSIATQFTERDVRTEQTAKDSKVAVDAALQAAKEAVGEQNKSSALAIAKSETATTKQIDQQGQLISTATKAIDDKIDDLKQRIGAVEGKAIGGRDITTDNRSSAHLILSVIMGVFGFASFVGMIIAFMRHP